VSDARFHGLLALARATAPGLAAIDPYWREQLLPELRSAPAARERLCAHPRTRRRLARLLAGRAGLGPLPSSGLDPADLHLAGLDREGLAAFVRLVGGVWHGATIARLVLREEVTAVRAGLGDEVHAEIFRWRERWVAPPASFAPEALIEAVDASGWRALGVWLAMAPSVVARRVLLRTRPERLDHRELSADRVAIAAALVRDLADRRPLLATSGISVPHGS